MRVRDRPLRVLMLSRSYPSELFPSLGVWVERPTARLNELDFVDVRVISPQPYCPPLPDRGPLGHFARFRRIPRHESRNGVDVIRPRYVAGPGWSTYGIESRSYELGVRRAVDRLRMSFPFDVIHAHFIYPEGAVAHRLSRRYDVPFITSEHAPWTARWFASRAVRRESLAAGRAAAALLVDSEYVRQSIAGWIGDRAPLRVVPVGVDVERFAPIDESERQPDLILFVGWLNFNKGVDVLLRAMEIIHSRGDPGRLLLVGGSYFRDTRRKERQLRQLADSLDLGGRVEFGEWPRPHEDIARLMAEAAVVVLPSRYEAFGTVLVEALACGTPVVATRCGGPEDFVKPAVGRLVPVDDPVALADALVGVLRERASFHSEQLRRYAVERFAWSRIVDGWLDAYASALDGSFAWFRQETATEAVL